MRRLQQVRLLLVVVGRRLQVALGGGLLTLLRALQGRLPVDAVIRLGLEPLESALRRALVVGRGSDLVREVLLDLLHERQDRLRRIRLAAVLARHATRVRRRVANGLAVRAGVRRGEALVPLGRRGLLELHEGRVVEPVQDLQGVRHRVLAGRGIRHSLLVLGLVLLAELRLLVQGLVQVGDLLAKRQDLLRALRDERLQLRHLRVQGLDVLLRLRLLGVRLGHVVVAPALLVRLRRSLLLQARHEVLDHLLHLGERARRGADLQEQSAQHRALQLAGLLRQEAHNLAALRTRVRLAKLALLAELEERDRLIVHVIIVIVRALLSLHLHERSRALARNRLLHAHEAEVRRGLVHLGDVTLEQLEGVRNRLELRRARRGARVPVLRLRLALRREVREEVLVRRLGVRRLLELRGGLVDLRIELSAHLRLLALGLLLGRDRVAARAGLHLERLEGVLLLLVAIHLLLAEILVELLEGRHDLVRVVGVAVRVTLKQRVGLLRELEGLRESNGLLHHALLREEGLLRTRHEVLRALERLDRHVEAVDRRGEVRGLRDVRSVLVITGLLGVVLLLVQLLDLS